MEEKHESQHQNRRQRVVPNDSLDYEVIIRVFCDGVLDRKI